MSDRTAERVLVVPTAVLHAAGAFQGFCPRADEYLPRLLATELAQSLVVATIAAAAALIVLFWTGASLRALVPVYMHSFVLPDLDSRALVFALGTRQHLANLIGAHYARKHYAPGDFVKVGGFEGRIVEIADGCVFIETDVGDVSVPGQHFSAETFVKIRKAT